MEIATSLWFLESFTLLLSDGSQPHAAQHVLAAEIKENVLVWTISDFSALVSVTLVSFLQSS